MGVSDDRIGTIVAGSYRLTRVIGEGGMGTVFEAEHTRVPRKFAVKLLKPEVAANREMFDRFRREAEIASASGHEHIVEVIDFNVTDAGTPYMVLEYLEGESLDLRLHRRGRLPIDDTATIIEAAASAVHATHLKGIVHRDLKPANLFLIKRGKRDDFVKVLDFGISKIMHEGSIATQPGSILGTPNYMAPEQLSGQTGDIDHRTDIWALGTIAYQCLGGRMAFSGPTVAGTLYQVCHAEPLSLRAFAPDVDEALERVILRALRKNRADRHENAASFRDDFLRAAGRRVDIQTARQGSLIEVSGNYSTVAIVGTDDHRGKGAEAFTPTLADQSGGHSAPPPAPQGTLGTSSRELLPTTGRRSSVVVIGALAVAALVAGAFLFTRGPEKKESVAPPPAAATVGSAGATSTTGSVTETAPTASAITTAAPGSATAPAKSSATSPPLVSKPKPASTAKPVVSAVPSSKPTATAGKPAIEIDGPTEKTL